MDKDITQVNQDTGWNLFFWIIFVLKKNVILILSVIILSAGIGTGYALARKYDFVSSCEISYTAKNVAYDSTTYNVSVMSAYLKTVVDFCDEGVVVDRANYYYDLFLRAKAMRPEITAFDFIDGYLNEKDDYTKNKRVDTQYINPSNIVSEGGDTVDNAVRFTFTIKYTDTVAQAANDKLAFIVYSASKEINILNEDNESVYFSGLDVNLQYLSMPTSAPSISKRKIIISATLIGFVLAIAVSCIRELLDGTVKDDVELYKITNVETLSYIIDFEGASNNV